MAVDKSLQELVWSRANRQCEYCKVSQAFDALPFELDHIIAVQHSGSATEGNLALACFACNHHKGSNIAGFDRVLQQTVHLFHPRRDAWSDHFPLEWTRTRRDHPGRTRHGTRPRHQPRFPRGPAANADAGRCLSAHAIAELTQIRRAGTIGAKTGLSREWDRPPCRAG